MFESELKAVAHSLGHFPSNTELRGLKRNDLGSQITKRGGFVYWSEKLGIPRVESDTDTGWEGEAAAAQRLKELGLSVEFRSTVKSPFDLLIDGLLRIDVKSARLTRYGYCCGWFYRIGKIPQSDVILLWQLDSGDFYAIPWFLCPHTNVTISRDGGKYKAFQNNVQLLREMLAVRQQEQRRLTR